MNIETIESEVLNLKDEMGKFESGNKSAGTRARKILQNIKNAAQEIRKDIQSKKAE